MLKLRHTDLKSVVEQDVYRDADVDATLLQNRSVAIIGYGNQGRAQALNLRDSGVQVTVGLRRGSANWRTAAAEGFTVSEIAAAVRAAEIVMLLVPDEVMGELYAAEVRANLAADAALGFAHGFAVHYHLIEPQGAVFMVSPKGTGEALRAAYREGTGLPSYVAVYRENDHTTLQLALAYAQAIGCTRRGAFLTTFKEETESDLFSEQAVLCGALGYLLRQAFEVLVEAGYAPRLAYFECVTEAKLVCDLLVREGFAAFGTKISNTAELGGHTACAKIMDSGVKERMRGVLQAIQDGSFAREFVEDYKNDFKKLKKYRAALQNHPIDAAGREVRELTNS